MTTEQMNDLRNRINELKKAQWNASQMRRSSQVFSINKELDRLYKILRDNK